MATSDSAGSGVEKVTIKEYGSYPFYRYRGYLLYDFIVNKVETINNFEVREDDVWVVTYPKAGTTWLQQIVYLIYNDLDFAKTTSVTLDKRFPYFEFPYPGMKKIASMPSPRCIKSHLPLSLLPAQMKEKRPKIIYLARNPKDTAVSYYHFAHKFLTTSIKFYGNFEDYCRLFVEDKAGYGPWWEHVLEGWRRRHDNNLLFLRYEDMKEDLAKVIRQVASFLDKRLTDNQVQSIMDFCSFDRMRDDKSANFDWMRKSGFATKDTTVKFMRKGVVGDWRTHFLEEMVRQFDSMVEERIALEGLHFRDSPSNRNVTSSTTSKL